MAAQEPPKAAWASRTFRSPRSSGSRSASRTCCDHETAVTRLGEAIDLSKIGDYRGFDEVREELAALRSARIETVAHGHEGAPILRVDIGDPVARSATIVIAGVHALEWIGVETVLALLREVDRVPSEARRVIAF